MKMIDLENVELHYVESIEEVNNFFNWLGLKRDFLSFDLETGGLSFWRDALRLFQLGDCNTAWAFRGDRWLGVLEEVMNKYEGPICGHNVYFDVRTTEFNNIHVPKKNLHDTMNMSHIIDPVKSVALKTRTSSMLSPQAKKLSGALAGAMKEQGWGWDTVPVDFPIYHFYGAFDCILTARLAEAYYPQIQAEFQDVYDLEMETSRICSNMEVQGTRIDLPYCNEKYVELTKYCQDAELWCLENYGVRPSENQQVAIALVKDGVDLSKTTASGQWSTDKDVLEGLEYHPLARTVLGHRQASKIRQSYFSNFLSMNDNGVLHPSIRTLGAKTGRMALSTPALQTIPRGSVVRNAFIPFEGQKMLSVDYSGVEARLFAHFANEEGLIKVFREGFDPHSYTAQQVFGVETPTKAQRQVAKNATFCMLYGGGPEKMGWTAGISTEDAAAFLDAYKARFPGVDRFMKSVEQVARERLKTEGRGYVKTPIGRRQIGVKDKLYALVNALIQGTSADVLKRALVDLDMAGFGKYMLLPIHDEILFSIPEEVDVNEIINIMEDRDSFRVPLICEASPLLEKWGDKV